MAALYFPINSIFLHPICLSLKICSASIKKTTRIETENNNSGETGSKGQNPYPLKNRVRLQRWTRYRMKKSYYQVNISLFQWRRT